MAEHESIGAELAVQGPGDVEVPRTLAAIGAEIREHAARFEYHKKATLWEAVEIGRRLTEAHDKTAYGEWEDFLTRETGYSRKIASNFIRVFEAYGDRQTALLENNSETVVNTYSHLSVSQALALLALPEDQREQFVAENDVESMTVREMKDAIRREREAREAAERDRDEARENYQKVEQDRQNRIQKIDEIYGDLEQARKDLEAVRQSNEGTALKISDLEGRLADAEERRDTMAERLEQEKANAANAEASRAEMERQMQVLQGVHDGTLAELDELKKKPVDVAVEPVRDEEAIEAARAEEREKLQAQYNQDMAALREELAAAQSAPASAADEDMAAFKVIFEQVQGQINALNGLVMKIEGRGDKDTAGRLRNALTALSVAVAQVAKGEAA